jgi:MFS superfamily sulfate permease-like transporter
MHAEVGAAAIRAIARVIAVRHGRCTRDTPLMTGIAHAQLPMIATPRYGTGFIGFPAALLLAGLVLLGVRGCRLGVEVDPLPAPAMAGALTGAIAN